MVERAPITRSFQNRHTDRIPPRRIEDLEATRRGEPRRGRGTGRERGRTSAEGATKQPLKPWE